MVERHEGVGVQEDGVGQGALAEVCVEHRLEMPQRLEAQVADQAADEARQVLGIDRWDRGHLGLERGEEVLPGASEHVDVPGLGAAEGLAGQGLAVQQITCARGHADERIARDALTAFDRFKQKRGAVAAQLEVRAGRRLEICRQFARQRAQRHGGFREHDTSRHFRLLIADFRLRVNRKSAINNRKYKSSSRFGTEELSVVPPKF